MSWVVVLALFLGACAPIWVRWIEDACELADAALRSVRVGRWLIAVWEWLRWDMLRCSHEHDSHPR